MTSKTVNGTTYQYDSTGLSAVTTSSGTTYVTRTPDGDLLSERTPSGTYYYLVDGLDSVVALTDSSGNVVNSYSYDPYGNTISSSEQVSNPFRYIGGVYDAQTGLYAMGERYYDPSTGRFTQPDPAGFQYGTTAQPSVLNRYVYAQGDPCTLSDPSGLYPKKHKKSNRGRGRVETAGPSTCASEGVMFGAIGLGAALAGAESIALAAGAAGLAADLGAWYGVC